ncbi:ornithine cyclodeaminase family protein [Aquicoccus porphyridii]|uniref:Ornithine cyclodeaminase family protein n=1 Tax=Aquicoccus porphyridii TaxID=1852029 RepID=A0A5A9ZCQ8_9RHOB|nr:ornithine cyclodeaminase family protein [Aquicoccus porphyridii]KAA0914940.1 ornithine cyclodeaminase family protein [Aquicoccus porphyridii]RAI52516.1 ornithine cyclodeaminase family protein [Rhodobacteraceae bacterium AsT-22]
MTAPRIFTAAEITTRIGVADLLQPLRRAMIAVSQGHALHPPRLAVPVNPNGRMGVMYGALSDPPVHGAKILSLYPGAPAMGLSSHQGYVLLFDSTDGRPLAIFDADGLTAMRTATVTMLATQALARPDPGVMTICGAGEQAEWHLRACLACFPNAHLRLWARDPAKARALRAEFAADADRIELVEDLAAALSGADVIHTVTSARTPFLPGALLEPGQHVNLVGASLADSREVDDAAVARLRMFTDSRESASREAGEILGAQEAGVVDQDYPVTELGAILAGDAGGRRSRDEITAYKSHGLIVQDLATAAAILAM